MVLVSSTLRTRFQSTLLQEERPLFTLLLSCQFQFQSTLLQEERHCSLSSKIYSSIISIHAPTRGATRGQIQKMRVPKFQSTLLQEERQLPFSASFKLVNFNPRSYKRSDNSFCCVLRIVIISIHAPTRGATLLFAPSIKRLNYFNPRSYKRSDGKNAQLSLYLSVIIIA